MWSPLWVRSFCAWLLRLNKVSREECFVSGMWQKFWSPIPESSRKSFSFYDMAPNFLRVMDMLSGYDISPESCHLLLLPYLSTLRRLLTYIRMLWQFLFSLKLEFWLLAGNVLNARRRRNYFVPLAIRLRYLWSVEEELKIRMMDVRDGGRT